MMAQDPSFLNFELDLKIRHAPIPFDWEAPNRQVAGYCYLALFPSEHHREIAYVIGAFPRWSVLKGYGANNAKGAFHIERRNGFVHIAQGGSGYTITDLNIRDSEVVGGFKTTTPLITYFLICMFFMLNLTFVEGRRRATSDSITVRLLAKFDGIKTPDGFCDMVTRYIAHYDLDVPKDQFCCADLETRESILDLDLDDDQIMYVIELICPTTIESGYSFHELDMVVSRERNNMRNQPKTTGHAVDSVLDTVSADVAEVAGAMHEAHATTKRATEQTIRLAGTRASETFDTAHSAVSKASGLVLQKGERAIDETLSIADEVAEATINQFTETAHTLIDQTQHQVKEVRNTFVQNLNAVTKMVWSTTRGVAEIIESRENVTADIATQTAELGDALAGVLKDPGAAFNNAKQNLPTISESGKAVVDTAIYVAHDGKNFTYTAYNATGNLMRAVYDNSYSADEIASGLTDPAKLWVESVVPAVQSRWIDLKENWRAYAGEGSNKTINIIDSAPYVSEKIGGTLAGFIRGFTVELGIEEVPNWFGRLRNATIGPPDPKVKRRGWSNSWNNFNIGFVNHVEDDESWKSFLATICAVAISFGLVMFADYRLGRNL